MIKPTIGRVVWVWPAKSMRSHAIVKDDQPFPALIACVHSDTEITVGGYDHKGQAFSAERIPLVPDDLAEPLMCTYAQWMPYQKGQAAKTEATERHLGEARRSSDESNIEQQLQVKGLTAPRITPAHLDAKIVSAQFHVFEGSSLTVCVLTLENGYTVTGESACVSPANFDRAIGENISYQKAREKLWPLEGYLLAQRLFEGKSHA